MPENAYESSVFDYIIVVCSHYSQLKFWEDILPLSVGNLLNANGQIILLKEEWNGPAGNGLGTLNALNQLREILSISKSDFEVWLKKRKIGIYHTAGKGTRIAPLTLSEGSNKGAIRLPHGRSGSITMLEAVILQTASYCKEREHSVFVFWSDQLFFSKSPRVKDLESDISVFTMPVQVDSASDWVNHKLDQYGVIIEINQSTQLLEKGAYWDFLDLVKKSNNYKVYKSLGCFSLSNKIASELLRAFDDCLEKHIEKLDTDPDIWKPILFYIKTGSWPKYTKLKLIESLSQLSVNYKTFGIIDLGENASWFDFGRQDLYFQTLQNIDAFQDLSSFLQLPKRDINGNILLNVQSIKSEIKNSIVCHSKLLNSKVASSLVINSFIQDSKMEQSLCYNASIENEVLQGCCYTAIDCLKENIKYITPILIDKDMWETPLDKNSMTFQEGYNQLSLEDQSNNQPIHIVCDFPA